MNFDMKFLTNTAYLPYPLLITLPNGYKVKVTQIGKVILASNIILNEVLYVPSFKYNLVSIQCLSKSIPKSVVSFTETSCILQAPSMKRPLVIGEAEGGLYFLCANCLKHTNYFVASNALTYISCSCNSNPDL